MFYNIQDRNRATGRTTALRLSAISEALSNPGKQIEFVDHYPHTYASARDHAQTLRTVINHLGLLNIKISVRGRAVFLVNEHDPWPRTALEEAWKKEVGRYPNEADLKDRSAFYYFRKGFDSTFYNSAFIVE
jgi:hypothetical protein